MKPIRVLLVDDHNLFRAGLVQILEKAKDFQVVGEAGDGEDGLKKAKDLKPDLVLMDIQMPGIDGIEATRRIHETLPATKVVILTVFGEEKKLVEAIKNGAHGYVLKNIQPNALFATLRGIFRGEVAISRVMATQIIGQLVEEVRTGPLRPAEEELSSRELEVLQFLTKGLTNKEIAQLLKITESTVKNHLRNILAKLHLANRVQAAAFALEKGIVPEDDQTR
jgi:two-component system nitrate/nitrite response regulator NarL